MNDPKDVGRAAAEVVALATGQPLMPQPESLLNICDRLKLPRELVRKKLTPIELEIVAEVLTGDTNKVIAARRFVVEKTVKFHLTNIYSKLGYKTRYEMIADLLAPIKAVG